MRRRAHAGHATVAMRKDFFDLARRNFSFADLDKRPDNSPAHLVKKTIGLDEKCQQRPAPFDVAAGDCANGGFDFISVRRRKRFEIMFTGKKLCRRPQRLQIQLSPNVPRRFSQQWIHRPLAEQAKIAQILSAWDTAIATTQQCIINSQHHPAQCLRPCG